MPDFWVHCAIALVARLMFIVYGEIQDNISVVQYTDIDYKVFTDAARYISEGNSPYNRHTYRYSPLLAILLVPNILIHVCWGKVFFSILDILVGCLIYNLLLMDKIKKPLAVRCTLFWLYNPLVIVISTRGNADSVSSVLVLLTLILIKKEHYILSGFMHGLAIHFRIYPIVFSLSMYLSIESPKIKLKTNKLHKIDTILQIIYPNCRRVKLALSCVITLLFLSLLFLKIYDFKFLEESFLFHLKRTDIKHNFSVYFYMQYLFINHPPSWINIVINFPLIILLTTVSFVYGTQKHLPFCELCLAVILVMYNSVLTCQYFLWFISLLPLSLPYLKFSKQQTLILLSLWLIAQVAWLLPAYLLEFRGRDTFLYVWLQSVAFFCANIAILSRLIRNYNVHSKLS
uniref:GPI alpha-1,4-mannosyltransferase I, catalytic subunit n=1 Tax=Clastoptera arizonana TaxID=38151 RepID=A0A1B6DAR5_9HEMI